MEELPINKQRVFVNRLEKMLDKYGIDDLRHWCPQAPKFDNGTKVCQFCKKITNTKHSYCPCYQHGCADAVKRAREGIKKWREENGHHQSKRISKSNPNQ